MIQDEEAIIVVGSVFIIEQHRYITETLPKQSLVKSQSKQCTT